jgi:nucleoid DNA-binding protein
MKKPEIARRIAQQSRLTQGEAADRLDGVVHQILSSLRKQKTAPLPGLGTFVQSPDGSIYFEPQKDERS